jgi:hypothetical protein
MPAPEGVVLPQRKQENPTKDFSSGRVKIPEREVSLII